VELEYTYWVENDGLFIGYLNSYPDHFTQGHDLKELEEMLADVYQIRQEEEKRLAQNEILENDYWKPVIEPANQEEIEMIDERMKDYESDPSSFSPLRR